MIRDEERREVARRLREKKAECEKRGYPWMCDDLILALGYDHDYEAGDEIFDRLADLIDPDCEEGRYSVARTVRPVDREAESGHESGQNPDTVQIESPTVQKATACDREALLAQVKELEKCAWYFGLDFDADEPLRDRLKEASEDFAGCADRIREACGEVVK